MSDVNKAEIGELEDGVAGVTLAVIDTPGYLATQRRCRDSKSGNESTDADEMLQEFSRALMYAKDGVDAVVVTLRCAEPASMEEEMLLDFLTEMKIWKHCIILFTHGSRVSEGKDEGYLDFYKELNSGEFAKECPVLCKFVENCERRFIVVESVDKAGDNHYYRSKLDELYAAVKTARKNAESPFNHPLLEMAKNSYEMVQLQKSLREEAHDKDAQLEATIREKDEVATRLGAAEKRFTDLKDALKKDPPSVGDDAHTEQDAEDAAAILLQYLIASEATDASPTQFVSTIRRLEGAERRQRETMIKLAELLEGIRTEKKKKLPRADLERLLESIMTPEQDKGEEVEANGAEDRPGRREETKLCKYL